MRESFKNKIEELIKEELQGEMDSILIVVTGKEESNIGWINANLVDKILIGGLVTQSISESAISRGANGNVYFDLFDNIERNKVLTEEIIRLKGTE